MCGFDIGLFFLIALGAGIGILVNNKYQVPKLILILISIIGVVLLGFGIPFMVSVCFVDGCSWSAMVITILPVFVGFELLVVGITIPILRKIKAG